MISEATALALTRALHTNGNCTCQFKRTPAGVPLWEGTPIDRVRLTTCNKCRALAMYEAERSKACEHVFAIPLVAICAKCKDDMPESRMEQTDGPDDGPFRGVGG